MVGGGGGSGLLKKMHRAIERIEDYNMDCEKHFSDGDLVL